jgi:uncharacterized protein involved in exopolysaccharide biosynthesis
MEPTKPNETEVNVGDLAQKALRICKKHRWLIALTALIVVVGVNSGLRFVPNKYRSQATILVLDEHLSSSFVTRLSAVTLEERTQAAAHEVLSQPRLLAIAGEFGFLTPDASPEDVVENLRKNIEIEPSGVSVFQVSFAAKTPQLAQGVCKKLADLFIERHSELQASHVQSATNMFDEQLAERRKKLAELQQEIQGMTGQYAAEPTEDTPGRLDDLRQAQARLDNVTSSRDRAKEQRAVWQSMLMGNLNARLTRLRDEKALLLKNFTPRHPDVVAKDAQITQVQTEMDGLRSGTLEHPQSTLVSGDPAILQLEGQLEANSLEIANLSKEIERQTGRVEQYQQQRRVRRNPANDQNLSAKTLEAKALNEEIADLARKQQQSGLAAAMEAREEQQDFRLVDPANLPTHPSSKKRQTASLAAIALGPLLGIVIAFLLEFRDNTFHTEKELRQCFTPPLIITVPVLPTPAEVRQRSWREGLVWVASGVFAIATIAVEFFAYKHS